MRSLPLLLLLALSGCLSLRPVATTVDSPSGVRVVLTGQDDELFRLEVINYSQCVILVDRDRVTLVSEGGERARIPGGLGSLYTIMPGGHHAVNVKFNLGNLRRGERVAIRLDGAVTAQTGQLMAVAPVEFLVE